MSLTGVAGPPGALAAGTAGNASAGTKNSPAGLPALFAALLAGQTAVVSDTTPAAASVPQKDGSQEKDGEHDRPGEDTNQPALPADLNAVLLLPVPQPALPAAPIVPTRTVTTNPPAALETAVSGKTLAAPTENQSEVMDTALAPAPTGLQKSSELLPQTAQKSAVMARTLVPSPTGRVTADPAGVTPPAAVPAPTGAPTNAAMPVAAGAPKDVVMPRPVDAGRPVATPPAPPNATAASAAPSLPTAPAVVPVTQTAPPAAPSVQTVAPAVAPQTQAASATVPAAQTVAPKTTAAPVPLAVPVPAADKTNPFSALQKPLAPANNTGRSLRSEGKAQNERAAQATPAFAQAADVSTQETVSARPAGQNADKKESTGFADLPAQAPTLTAQTGSALPAKPERGTAARQVAEEIVTLKLSPGAARQVVVNLHPRDWGQVRVEVTMAPAQADGTAGAVTARLSADNPQARAALEASSGELKRILHDAGLHLDTVTVTADTVQAASQSAAAGGNGTPFQPHDGGGQNGFAGPGNAFAGGQNMASGGGQGAGGGGSHSQEGRTASGLLRTAEPDAAQPLPLRMTAKSQGVDIRA